MYRNQICLNQKIILFLLILPILLILLVYQNLLIKLQKQRPISYLHIDHQDISKNASSLTKISIAYYTTLYAKRIDSHSKIFNGHLKEVCQILDPEDYPLADSVFVSIVDFIRFPIAYRHLHQSQLWLFHSEESPRNSYRTVDIKNLTELDDWFNFTSTLQPESDFHIQYLGYRIKPAIGNLLHMNLSQTIDHSSDISTNTSSIYINTLSSILDKELINQQKFLLDTCPYTCNQPLSSHALASLQPHLQTIKPKVSNRRIVYIAWFVSNCNTHSRREDYARRLRAQDGIHIDIYGKCQSIHHAHIIPNQCEKGLSNCTKKTLSNYRFYLSFENSKCDTYISEKYWIQGLNKHAVPIVLGAKKEQYQRIAVPNSYIHVDDFQTVEDLAKELHRLNRNDTEFMKYLQWTQLYDVSTQYQPISANYMHSALCFLGHYQYLHSISERTPQIEYVMNTIRKIFNLTNLHLSSFNWTTAKTNLIRISELYNPTKNCWDADYPSVVEQIYKHLFTWWKLF